MKKILLMLVIVLWVVSSNSKLLAQTTMEEYNYVTKGYQVQIESGLDSKKGYEVVSLKKDTAGIRTAELKVLYRLKDEKKEIAAYMVVYQKFGDTKRYYCIPHPNSDKEILRKYWNQLYDGLELSGERLQLITYILSTHMKWQ